MNPYTERELELPREPDCTGAVCDLYGVEWIGGPGGVDLPECRIHDLGELVRAMIVDRDHGTTVIEAEAMLRLVFARTRPGMGNLRAFAKFEFDADGELCATAEASMTDTDEAAIVLGVYARHAERIEAKVAEAGR